VLTSVTTRLCRVRTLKYYAVYPEALREFSDALECDWAATWTDSAALNETLPINCVTWFEAFAFCYWDGGRLPTEAEWEFAAAGGPENRVFAWGEDLPTAAHAVFGGSAILPVGSKPAGAGRYGHLDPAGSVHELMLDLYSSQSSAPCDNCAALTSGPGRVTRGTAWSGPDYELRVAFRNFTYLSATQRDMVVGFRCARDVAP
jgi:formylglycine-generating enzyme required for sulfatase activity